VTAAASEELDPQAASDSVSSSATPTGTRSPYVYFEDEPGRRAAMKLLTRDEAPHTAVNIAKWPRR
jgi:hypothetical protein